MSLVAWGLPENYKDPSTVGDYLKLGNKEHYDVRVLGDWNQPRTAVHGWVGWKDTVNEHGQDVLDPQRNRLGDGWHIIRIAQLLRRSQPVDRHRPDPLMLTSQ